MKKLEKIFKTLLLIVPVIAGMMIQDSQAFCGFGFVRDTTVVATPPPVPCNCPSNRAAIKIVTNNICQTKCVSSGASQHYLSQGWSYGCCSAARIGIQTNEETSFTGVYPNPVSDFVVVSFYLLQEQTISLEIVDVNGRLIATIADNSFPSGANEIRWNTNSLNAGIYLSIPHGRKNANSKGDCCQIEIADNYE